MSSPSALLVVLPLAAALAHVVWTDLAERRIANGAVLAVLALWPVQLLLTGRPDPWWTGPPAGLLVLAVGLIAWRAGVLGGGDVKLAAALATLAGLGGLAEFLLVTTLAGGLLALVMLLADRIRPWLAALAGQLLSLPVAGRLGTFLLGDPAGRPASVPYGIALATGGLWWALALLGHS
ncbi:MAG: prepilin peptidase [Geminicoccaceae bacterium]|nr:prepilin peptidase [Geminicoccaceae bacterium]